MRDRAKIIVNNREVAKRYLGSRLVWEEETIDIGGDFKIITIESKYLNIHSSAISIYVRNIKNKLNNLKIYKLKFNKDVIDLNTDTMEVVFFGNDSINLRNLSKEVIDKIAEEKSKGYSSITFYVK